MALESPSFFYKVSYMTLALEYFKYQVAREMIK